MLKTKLYDKKRYLQAFFIAMAVATAFFGIYIFADKGYFLYYGDFNVQQVSFYKVAHQAIRSGNFFWNWNTDLGANFIGSYSFYLLGSPFFWLTLPFPTDFVPHLMGPLLILKFSCASLAAFCYIRRFVKNEEFAVIGGLLYAFSGFSVYNVFFNHFHEAIVFFPLLLLAIEKFMCENKRGYVALAIMFSAFANYYFFFGMVLFAMIYWFLRLFMGKWEFKLSNFLWFVFELLLGVILAGVILLPSFFTVIANNRVSSYISGWGGLLYNKPQHFLYIIQCFFFPPDNPARPVFFPGAEVKWSSVAGWLPLTGMTGVIAWLQCKKGTWQKRLLTACIFIALIPVLNSAFSLFNTSYYARWFYMPILIMSLVTAQAFEDPDIKWAPAFRWSLGITLAFTVAIGLFPSNYNRDDKWYDFGLYTDANIDDSFYHSRFWLECLIAIGSIVVLFVLMWLCGYIRSKKNDSKERAIYNIKKNKTLFWRGTVCAVCIISVLYSALHIGWGKEHSYDTTEFIIPVMLEGEEIDIPIKDGERIDVYEGMDNTAMFLGFPSIQCFHSVVPASIMDFWEYVGVVRNVASRPETKYYHSRALLNCRYLFDYTGDGETFSSSGTTKMPGYSYYKTENQYDIYVNQYAIPYGSYYNYCITAEEIDKNYNAYKGEMMLKALILSNEDCNKYSGYIARRSSYSGFSEEDYKTDAAALRETSINNHFEIDESNGSFVSTVNLPQKRLVFYAVPYESGWSAYVDGEKVEIIRANIGFMAIPVDEGQHTIEFKYMTPGLPLGGALTIIGLIFFVTYLVLWKKYAHILCKSVTVRYPEGEEKAKLEEEYDYIYSLYEASIPAVEEVAPAEENIEIIEISEIIDFEEDDGIE